MAAESLVNFLKQEMTKKARSNKSVILDSKTFVTLITVIEQLNEQVNSLTGGNSDLSATVSGLSGTVADHEGRIADLEAAP